jgi:hypothetical protein
MMSRFFRLSLVAAALGLAVTIPVSSADAAGVGAVLRLRGEATAQAAGQTRTLAQGTEIDLGDRLKTGPGARLEVKFSDGTDLTLGENADFTIDALAVSGDTGTALFTRAAGALLLAGGEIAKLPQHRIEIASSAGTIGIRGTTVWGGTIKPGSLLDVLLIEGAVEVRTAAGAVVLDQPGLGTSVTAAGGAPQIPTSWAQALRANALATVSFDTP